MRSAHDYRVGSKSLYRISHRARSAFVSSEAIEKRRDEAKYGEYRTKRVILEIYDEMKLAMKSGAGYQKWLDHHSVDERAIHTEPISVILSFTMYSYYGLTDEQNPSNT